MTYIVSLRCSRVRKKYVQGAGSGLRLDMQIRNFGPIRDASISLRPLTVFIGPNNTGKSYAAMLAHSIISSCRSTGADHHPAIDRPGKATGLEKILRYLKVVLASLKLGEPTECPQALEAAITRLASRRLAEKAQNEIERNFGAPLADLARFRSRRFSVSLGSGGGLIVTGGSGGMDPGRMQGSRIRFRLARSKRRGPVRVTRSGGGVLDCAVHRGLLSDKNSSALRRVYEELECNVLQDAISALRAASRYFPAGRAGMLQAHGAMQARIASSAPYVGTESTRAERLPGIASDFVSGMIEMRPQHGECRDLGEEMENDVLGGRVDLKPSVAGAVPELAYKRRLGASVPVRLASSAIPELAPLTLYLKHKGRANDMLVVEEPEARLHPSSQRLLARHLVRLVKSGISVIVTTHSAILLEVVSQCLLSSKMSPKNRKRVIGDENLCLGIDEVAPHLFRPDRGGACIVERIPMYINEGISQEEFIEVDRLLNIDNIRIEECSN